MLKYLIAGTEALIVPCVLIGILVREPREKHPPCMRAGVRSGFRRHVLV